MKTNPLTQYSFIYKVIFINIFIVSTFFLGDVTRVNAEVKKVWYMNQLSSSCILLKALGGNCYYDDTTGSNVCPPRTGYDPDESTWPAGYTLTYQCTYGNDGDVCDYYACSTPTNRPDLSTGAQATFAASVDKALYAPGELMRIDLAAITGDKGYEVGGDLAMITRDILPWGNDLLCFIFGCEDPPTVSISAAMPVGTELWSVLGCEVVNTGYSIYEMGWNPVAYDPLSAARSGAAGTFVATDIPGDPYPESLPRNGQDCRPPAGYKKVMRVPMVPGVYSIPLQGCHQDFGCANSLLNFEVGAPTPTVQLFFGRLMEKIKGIFVSL